MSAPDTSEPFLGSALTTILVVTDLEKSRHFYIDQLGAELYRAYGGTSMVIQFLGNWLLLVTAGGPTEDKPHTSFLPPTNVDEVSHAFTIRVKDCRHSYQALHSKGISFITPPVDNGAETRCFFRDPDGHLFEISEYRTSA